MRENPGITQLNKNLELLKNSGFNIPDKKYCSQCGEYLDFDQFYASPNARFGITSSCKECLKKYQTPEKVREKKYGLSEEKYQELVLLHNNQCAVCGIPGVEATKGILYIDHDHTTGKIRGLLCAQCNAALGMVKESKETLQKLIDYLDFYGDKSDAC